MSIKYLTPTARKNANTELRLEYIMHDDRISHPMRIDIPETSDYIIVDAEAMQIACQKVIALEKI